MLSNIWGPHTDVRTAYQCIYIHSINLVKMFDPDNLKSHLKKLFSKNTSRESNYATQETEIQKVLIGHLKLYHLPLHEIKSWSSEGSKPHLLGQKIFLNMEQMESFEAILGVCYTGLCCSYFYKWSVRCLRLVEHIGQNYKKVTTCPPDLTAADVKPRQDCLAEGGQCVIRISTVEHCDDSTNCDTQPYFSI